MDVVLPVLEEGLAAAMEEEGLGVSCLLTVYHSALSSNEQELAQVEGVPTRCTI